MKNKKVILRVDSTLKYDFGEHKKTDSFSLTHNQAKELKKLIENVFYVTYEYVDVFSNSLMEEISKNSNLMEVFNAKDPEDCLSKIFPIISALDANVSEKINRELIDIEIVEYKHKLKTISNPNGTKFVKFDNIGIRIESIEKVSFTESPYSNKGITLSYFDNHIQTHISLEELEERLNEQPLILDLTKKN